MDKLPHLEDDGLDTPEVGDWSETKYRLLSIIAGITASSMKSKWDSRVYIDLFAAAGKARIKNTGTIVPTSPLLALNVHDKYDKYIFCEKDDKWLKALRQRVQNEHLSATVEFIGGDVNNNADQVLNAIAPKGGSNKILTFCFVDPCNLRDFKFETIQKLSQRRAIDFLILLPSFMDVHRNLKTYIDENHTLIEEFTGTPNWRELWEQDSNRDFGLFFLDVFCRKMKELGFYHTDMNDIEPVHQTGKRLLYHLAYFSRHELGAKFWKEARKYSSDQLKLL